MLPGDHNEALVDSLIGKSGFTRKCIELIHQKAHNDADVCGARSLTGMYLTKDYVTEPLDRETSTLRQLSNMKIAVFLEGSPGHEKQSMAVVRELEKLVQLETRLIHVQKRSTGQRILRAFQFLAGMASMHPEARNADLLIGTGSQTHIDMLAAKKELHIPAVVCMAPDFIYRKSFDLCFVPRHDGIAESRNIFLTDGPPVPTPVPSKKDLNKGLILIGGPNAYSCGWCNDDICGKVKTVIENESGKQWTMSTSPRTPEETSNRLRDLADHYPNLDFFHFRDTPAGWVEDQYAASSTTWVTVDSMSMIYEALTAGCKVGLLPLEWKKENNKFSRSMVSLQEKGLALGFTDWLDGSNTWEHAPGFNEAKRCAEEIVKRWG